MKAVVNHGKSRQYVVISTAHWFAEGIRAHGVFTRCAIRVGLVWMAVFGVVGKTGGAGEGTAGPASLGDCARLVGTSHRGDAVVRG